MLGKQPLDAMSEDQILGFAAACADTIRDAEADLLRAAYQWAVIHDPDRLDPVETARSGRSSYAGARLIADAQDLHHRHPQLWARVQAGEVRASYARHVATQTRELSRSEAAFVDAEVAESADGRIPWSRFETLVTAKVAQAAPEAARQAEERASDARFARKLRTEAHGMASFMIRADLATIDAIDAAVTRIAGALGETMPEATNDDRRVHALLLMAHPGAEPSTGLADLLPDVLLHVHTYRDSSGQDDGAEIVRVEGHGPVTEAWVRRVLGPHARFRIQPVIDLAGQAPVDAYEIPDRHRRAVHLMTPADTFPFATCLSRRMQVDHTVPHGMGGVSGVGNYGPMTVQHHRIKTHGRWQVQQPFPGIYVWRDPHGGFYVVDHTGTRRLPRPATESRLDIEFSQLLLALAA